jgi:ferric iron reductase protein FhuF
MYLQKKIQKVQNCAASFVVNRYATEEDVLKLGATEEDVLKLIAVIWSPEMFLLLVVPLIVALCLILTVFLAHVSLPSSIQAMTDYTSHSGLLEVNQVQFFL